jgi:hypothetical protein
LDLPLVASYSLRGYLAPLDEYFTADDIKKTWLEASGKAGTYNGHFMAAPQNTSSQFMYFHILPTANRLPEPGAGISGSLKAPSTKRKQQSSSSF